MIKIFFTLFALVLIFFFSLGLYLIIAKTIESGPGKYLAPVGYLYGFIWINFCAAIAPIAFCKNIYIFGFASRLRNFFQKTTKEYSNGQRGLFLFMFVLMLCLIMTDGTSRRLKFFSESIFISLFFHISFALITSFSLFCWVGSVLYRKSK